MLSAGSVVIGFRDQSEASVRVSIRHADMGLMDNQDATHFGELVMFACYTMRQMVNLGATDGDSLAGVLALTVENALGLRGVVTQAARTLQLISDEPDTLPRVFRANAEFDPYGDPGRTRFVLTTKGFGLLGRGLGYYSPMSVLALLLHLVNAHANDPTFLRELQITAQLCAHAWLERKVTLQNQSYEAYNLAWGAWAIGGVNRLPLLIKCRQCGAMNRVDRSQLRQGRQAICGNCKAELEVR